MSVVERSGALERRQFTCSLWRGQCRKGRAIPFKISGSRFKAKRLWRLVQSPMFKVQGGEGTLNDELRFQTMARGDQIRWDRKHREGYATREPSAFLIELSTAGSWEIPPGRALDIATGRGRNALLFAKRGFGAQRNCVQGRSSEDYRWRRSASKQVFPLPSRDRIAAACRTLTKFVKYITIFKY
jgi:hypothetical protein